MKQFLALLLALAMIFTLAACGSTDAEPTAAPEETQAPEPARTPEPVENYDSFDVRSYASDWEYHEICYVGNNEAKYVEMPYYALENVVYCTDPVDETFQLMNIYVPANYMTEDEDGKVSMNAKGIFGVMGSDDSTIMYMSDEAPVIFINTISGYAAAKPAKINEAMQGANAGYYYQFVEQGFVLVCVGARGRTSTDADGNVNGIVPAGLVDLKSGVRWLKYNDEYLPGDSNKIISIGVSAGGGMATMLGASGDSELFTPYLDEIGALDASDAVWATVPYCPVTDLPFADGVAQWEYGAKTDNDFTGALSRGLYNAYVKYMQSLDFDLGDDGVSGAFYEGLLAEFEDAFDDYIASGKAKGDELVAEKDPKGSWMSWSEDGGVKISSIKDYVDNYWAGPMPINGLVPTFDTFDNGSMEGGVFGAHFSWMMREVLEELSADYPEAAEYAKAYASDLDGGMSELADLYDPIHFITDGTGKLAEHWRFQIGSEDSNITQAAAWTVYNALNDYADVDANYAILYGIGHQTVEFSPYDLITWIYEQDLGATPKYDNIKAVLTVENPNAGSGGAASDPYDTVAGTYEMDETNAMGMEIHWILELNMDGTYVLSETGVVEKSYTGVYGAIDGIVSCGPINEDDGPRGDAFGDGFTSVWQVNKAAGTISRADLSKYTEPAAPGASGGGADVAISGVFTLSETNAVGMDVTWTLELNEDKTYALSETGIVDKTYTGTYGYDGTYVSCGPINEADGPRGDAFAEDDGWYSVWTVNEAAGSCAHADLGNYRAPGAGGGAAADISGVFTLSETNAVGMDVSWTLELNEDKTYALSETGIVDKTYTGTYSYDGTYVSCGPINEADGPRGDAFAEGDGWYSVWTVNEAAGTCAHADLGNYKAP